VAVNIKVGGVANRQRDWRTVGNGTRIHTTRESIENGRVHLIQRGNAATSGSYGRSIRRGRVRHVRFREHGV